MTIGITVVSRNRADLVTSSGLTSLTRDGLLFLNAAITVALLRMNGRNLVSPSLVGRNPFAVSGASCCSNRQSAHFLGDPDNTSKPTAQLPPAIRRGRKRTRK